MTPWRHDMNHVPAIRCRVFDADLLQMPSPLTLMNCPRTQVRHKTTVNMLPVRDASLKHLSRNVNLRSLYVCHLPLTKTYSRAFTIEIPQRLSQRSAFLFLCPASR